MAEIVDFYEMIEPEANQIEGEGAAAQVEGDGIIGEFPSKKLTAFEIMGAALDIAENENGDIDGLELLAYTIALPDEQFETIKELLLQSFEQTFASKGYRAAIEEIVNTYNLDYSTATAEFETMIEGFKNMEGITDSKIDFLVQISNMFLNIISDVKEAKVISLPFELCHPDAKMPTYANEGDSGMDIYAIDDYTIKPGEEIKVPTGLKCAIPYGYELQVRPKSGRAYKTRLRIANTPGTIDAGYRDEICVLIENIDPPIKDVTYYFDNNHHPVLTSILHGSPYTINKGEKFAQLVLMEVPKARPYAVEKVSSFTGNRGGGFGSSGLK